MSRKITIVAPDTDLEARAMACAQRYRAGEFGEKNRIHHRDAVFLHPPEAFTISVTDWGYRIDVWGDPAGHIRAYAHRQKEPTP